MDVSAFTPLIAEIGFPIVCCIALGIFVWKMFEKLSSQSEKREEKLVAVITTAQKTNEDLTKTNAEFVEVLRTYKNDLDDIKEDVSEIKMQMKGKGE